MPYSNLQYLVLRWFHSIALRILSAHQFLRDLRAHERARVRNLVGFLWKLSCWEKWIVVFSKTNSVTPLFYSIYLKKTRLCMIHPNFKNFSLFNFEIFQLIHYYSQILGVSLQPCRRTICLLFQSSLVVTAILRRFTVTLYFYHMNNAYISLLVTTLLK